MKKVPNSIPQMGRADVEKILQFKNIPRDKFKVCVLAVRGYYLNSMGEAGKNDRGIFDDAAFVVSPTAFVAVNWNTDPSSYRKGHGQGTAKGMATLNPGVWDYKIGLHKGRGPACRQAAPVTVTRDGEQGDYEDTGDFAINHHWGSATGTSSAGCQTAPPDQWPAYIGALTAELKRYDQKTFKYVLITEGERLNILNIGGKPEQSTVNTPTEQIPRIGGSDPDEGTPEWYRKAFKFCHVVSGKESSLAKTVDIVARGFEQYLEVAVKLGCKDPEVFAWILGAIHWKEASCNFNGVLHNGERIIGTGKKTSIVPKGRGPFATWSEAAVDAIETSSRWTKILAGSNDIGEILYAVERFNGTGYITGAGKAETSPYLWACSNINDGFGKYVSDGKFDPKASTGATCGAALILKELYDHGQLKIRV